MGILPLTLTLLALGGSPVLPAFSSAATPMAVQEVRAHETLDLTNRHSNRKINAGYGDNIRLYLHYLKGDSNDLSHLSGGKKEVDWEIVRRPFAFNLTLAPGQFLTFHPAVLPEFKDKKIQTAATNLSASDGYRLIDGLWGNGVCHLASFLNMTAAHSGLAVTAKVNHNFAPIYGVPARYGTAIYYDEKSDPASENQNLYIQNQGLNPVTLMFSVGEKEVEIVVTETVGFITNG